MQIIFIQGYWKPSLAYGLQGQNNTAQITLTAHEYRRATPDARSKRKLPVSEMRSERDSVRLGLDCPT